MGLEVDNVAWELETNDVGWKLNIIWCEVKTWCVKSKAWGWENKNNVAGDQNYQLRSQRYGFGSQRHGVVGRYHGLGSQ